MKGEQILVEAHSGEGKDGVKIQEAVITASACAARLRYRWQEWLFEKNFRY
jgi:hypothetical protein